MQIYFYTISKKMKVHENFKYKANWRGPRKIRHSVANLCFTTSKIYNFFYIFKQCIKTDLIQGLIFPLINDIYCGCAYKLSRFINLDIRLMLLERRKSFPANYNLHDCHSIFTFPLHPAEVFILSLLNLLSVWDNQYFILPGN